MGREVELNVLIASFVPNSLSGMQADDQSQCTNSIDIDIGIGIGIGIQRCVFLFTHFSAKSLYY